MKGGDNNKEHPELSDSGGERTNDSATLKRGITCVKVNFATPPSFSMPSTYPKK